MLAVTIYGGRKLKVPLPAVTTHVQAPNVTDLVKPAPSILHTPETGTGFRAIVNEVLRAANPMNKALDFKVLVQRVLREEQSGLHTPH